MHDSSFKGTKVESTHIRVGCCPFFWQLDSCYGWENHRKYQQIDREQAEMNDEDKTIEYTYIAA